MPPLSGEYANITTSNLENSRTLATGGQKEEKYRQEAM